MTSYPDGSPAKTYLTISAQGGVIASENGKGGPKPLLIETDESGIATLIATPTDANLVLDIKARDPQGQIGRISFNSDWLDTGEASILVRPDQGHICFMPKRHSTIV